MMSSFDTIRYNNVKPVLTFCLKADDGDYHLFSLIHLFLKHLCK